MAKTLGPLVDELLRRVRDEHAIANPRDLVRRFLRHAEGLVGVGLRINQETITFTTERRRLIYVLPCLVLGCPSWPFYWVVHHSL